MKILQINKFFYLKGGSETYLFSLADLLKQHGHEVIFFSMKDKKNFDSEYSDFFINNIDFRKREGIVKDFKKLGHSLYSLEAKRKLENLIKKYEPDVAHLHNVAHHFSPSILSVLKKHNIPVIQTLHDYQLICPNFKLFTKGAICERCYKHKYYQAIFHKCIHNAYLPSIWGAFEMVIHKALQIYENVLYYYVSPSEFLAKKLEKWGYNKDKIKVLNNFIDLAKISPNYNSQGYILYFGRLAQEKGILTLLEAIKGLSGIKLKVAGIGPEEAKLKDYLKKEDLPACPRRRAQAGLKNVEFLGFKKGEELETLISNCAFVVMPSIWYENYPYSILESFAYGKPVIGSDLGGIPEMVLDNKTGFIFPAGDSKALKEKIETLYNSQELIEQMGKQARQFVENNNDPEKHYQKLIKIYQELLLKYEEKKKTNKFF